jgi:lysophospholipid acyltransferase (LPLAT)-like uncharacterized protein
VGGRGAAAMSGRTDDLRAGVLGAVGRWVSNALFATIRFDIEHGERLAPFLDRGEPVIFSLWHGRLLPLTYYHRRLGVTAIISQSRDGDFIARLVEGWGYDTVRGSTSRGGRQALVGLVRAVRSGRSVAITPDGPRGPRQRLQTGVLTVAQMTDRPIIPVGCGTSRAWWPGGWDRFCVPKPFARVRIRYGHPRFVPRDASPGELARHAEELEREMNALTEELDRDGGPNR